MTVGFHCFILKVFKLLSGVDGKVVWTFSDRDVRNPIMNIYTAQFIRDISGDGIPDVLAIHGGDPLAEPSKNIKYWRLAYLIHMQAGYLTLFIFSYRQQNSSYWAYCSS